MKKFYIKSILFWFVLLILALINAIIRETTYKPILTPYIGFWAHQISSLTGILLFFIAIYLFLKYSKDDYSKKDLIISGIIWILMTLIFESLMNYYIRKLTFQEIIQTYYFWSGNTWIFVLLSLIISPLIIYKILKK
jgi:uncharacterized membrane protein